MYNDVACKNPNRRLLCGRTQVEVNSNIRRSYAISQNKKSIVFD